MSRGQKNGRKSQKRANNCESDLEMLIKADTIKKSVCRDCIHRSKKVEKRRQAKEELEIKSST